MCNIGAPVTVWKASTAALDQCYRDFCMESLLYDEIMEKRR